jgi:Xaa-Pro aminopeptidase
VDEARRVAIECCASALQNGESVSEGSLAAVITAVFADHGLTTGSDPDVAVGANAADPHYSLVPGDTGATVEQDSILLIDLFAQVRDEPDAPYADSTWMAYTGPTPPADVQTAFDAVRQAREAAVQFIDSAIREGRAVRGRDADRVARETIAAAELEGALIHRTGHSLGVDHVHGMGTNLDDIEFPDDRHLLLGSGFTVEPGLYFPGRFGIRSEVSAILRPDGVHCTTESQKTLTLLDVSGL